MGCALARPARSRVARGTAAASRIRRRGRPPSRTPLGARRAGDAAARGRDYAGDGNRARPARPPGARVGAARRAVRTAAAPQESGVHNGRGRHTGAGDWRQHRDVQRPECGSAPAPSVSVAGTVGDVVDRESGAEHPRGPIGTLGCRAVADSQSELRGHRHVRRHVQNADGS